jgi:hypothetical protein
MATSHGGKSCFLHKNETWRLVDLLEGKQTMKCKWVFKIKPKTNGTIDQYKVKLVAKGCFQKYGIGY